MTAADNNFKIDKMTLLDNELACLACVDDREWYSLDFKLVSNRPVSFELKKRGRKLSQDVSIGTYVPSLSQGQANASSTDPAAVEAEEKGEEEEEETKATAYDNKV
eukprot:TRINITY_DN27599_c0_g1_i1.p2 TRINITY_DN27599_c0_g1~~TRINITY_DN27599_c0_g1_i1.p2  ORF type:complete len:106 (+),score=16.52 TRINITY_DN27599_c0_g1_i1:337-654(+)